MNDRLFWGIAISGDCAARIEKWLGEFRSRVERRAPDGARQVRWTHAESWHLTLKFLGSSPRERTPELVEAAREVLASASPENPVIRLHGAGAFPSAARPRVLWVGASEKTGNLAALAHQFESRMSAFGFPVETRDFHPHLTIGRLKGESRGSWAELLLPERDVDFGEFPMTEVVLFKSVLRPSGSIYLPEIRLPWPA